MRLRFFLIPVYATAEGPADLNQFLAAHRVLAIDRQFVSDGPSSAWAVCVTYDGGGGEARSAPARRGKVDYRDLLTPPEFAVFARLRALRKDMADGEGVPAYALFTNEHLMEMVQRRVTTVTALGTIPGVGQARVEKYGTAFLQVLTEAALPGEPIVGDPADET